MQDRLTPWIEDAVMAALSEAWNEEEEEANGVVVVGSEAARRGSTAEEAKRHGDRGVRRRAAAKYVSTPPPTVVTPRKGSDKRQEQASSKKRHHAAAAAAGGAVLVATGNDASPTTKKPSRSPRNSSRDRKKVAQVTGFRDDKFSFDVSDGAVTVTCVMDVHPAQDGNRRSNRKHDEEKQLRDATFVATALQRGMIVELVDWSVVRIVETEDADDANNFDNWRLGLKVIQEHVVLVGGWGRSELHGKPVAIEERDEYRKHVQNLRHERFRTAVDRCLPLICPLQRIVNRTKRAPPSTPETASAARQRDKSPHVENPPPDEPLRSLDKNSNRPVESSDLPATPVAGMGSKRTVLGKLQPAVATRLQMEGLLSVSTVNRVNDVFPDFCPCKHKLKALDATESILHRASTLRGIGRQMMYGYTCCGSVRLVCTLNMDLPQLLIDKSGAHDGEEESDVVYKYEVAHNCSPPTLNLDLAVNQLQERVGALEDHNARLASEHRQLHTTNLEYSRQIAQLTHQLRLIVGNVGNDSLFAASVESTLPGGEVALEQQTDGAGPAVPAEPFPIVAAATVPAAPAAAPTPAASAAADPTTGDRDIAMEENDNEDGHSGHESAESPLSPTPTRARRPTRSEKPVDPSIVPDNAPKAAATSRKRSIGDVASAVRSKGLSKAPASQKRPKLLPVEARVRGTVAGTVRRVQVEALEVPKEVEIVADGCGRFSSVALTKGFRVVYGDRTMRRLSSDLDVVCEVGPGRISLPVEAEARATVAGTVRRAQAETLEEAKEVEILSDGCNRFSSVALTKGFRVVCGDRTMRRLSSELNVAFEVDPWFEAGSGPPSSSRHSAHPFKFQRTCERLSNDYRKLVAQDLCLPTRLDTTSAEQFLQSINAKLDSLAPFELLNEFDASDDRRVTLGTLRKAQRSIAMLKDMRAAIPFITNFPERPLTKLSHSARERHDSCRDK